MEGCGNGGHVGREAGGGGGDVGVQVVVILRLDDALRDGGLFSLPAVNGVCCAGVLERDGFGFAINFR